MRIDDFAVKMATCAAVVGGVVMIRMRWMRRMRRMRQTDESGVTAVNETVEDGGRRCCLKEW